MDKKVPPGRDDKKPGKKRTKVICLIAAILLLILMLLLLFRCCTVSDHGEPPVGPKVSDDVLVDGELETEKSESIDPQYFKIKVKAYQRAVAQIRACLLYTSPSPRDTKTSRMPSSA